MLSAAARLCCRPSLVKVPRAMIQQACQGSRNNHVVAACSSTDSSLVRKVRLAHIMLPLDQTTQLDDLEQQIRGGADFSEVARKHSQCPSARQGGELGWLSRSQCPPGFEPVMTQPVGQLVRAATARGLHLVNILEEKLEAEVQHMSVQDLQELLANPLLSEEVQFIDVREPWEYQTAKLPHFKLLPLSESSSWAPTIDQDFDPHRETVVLCHHGVRSMNTSLYLVSQGFTDVKNVTGGIAAYSRIDPSVPDY